MPRKRKAARAYRQVNEDARERIRRKYSCLWAMFDAANPAKFYDLLTTDEDRLAFQQEFPAEFFEAFNFEHSDFDEYPASSAVVHDAAVFRRENFATDFLKAHPPVKPFTAPDLRPVALDWQYQTMALARAEWWRANDWPMTDKERQWLLRGGPRRTEYYRLPGPEDNEIVNEILEREAR